LTVTREPSQRPHSAGASPLRDRAQLGNTPLGSSDRPACLSLVRSDSACGRPARVSERRISPASSRARSSAVASICGDGPISTQNCVTISRLTNHAPLLGTDWWTRLSFKGRGMRRDASQRLRFELLLTGLAKSVSCYDGGVSSARLHSLSCLGVALWLGQWQVPCSRNAFRWSACPRGGDVRHRPRRGVPYNHVRAPDLAHRFGVRRKRGAWSQG
jgi:hypothetical protein